MTQWTTRTERREFWLIVRDGASFQEAAARLGLNRGTGTKWARQSGGVTPHYVTKAPSKGRYLCLRERIQIQVGVHMELSIRAIARGLGRAPSTVQREIDKNTRTAYRARLRTRKTRRRPQHRGPRPYTAHDAQRRAENRASAAARSRPTRLATRPALTERVQHLIGVEDLSPRQVEAQLRIDLPEDPEMWVSHETIYKALYVQGRGELHRDLHKRLRTGRAMRNHGAATRSGSPGSRAWSTSANAQPKSRTARYPGTGRAT